MTAIKAVLDKVAPRITRLKTYLANISSLCTELEIHIPWLLPTGLKVRQSYMQEKTVKIKPFSYNRTQINLSTYIKKIDLNKQTRAFMPNLIHSLDATSLMLLLDKYFNNSEFLIKNIYTIHDCFAMPMTHVEFIIDTLRKVYISLYSNSRYLEKLDKGVLDSIACHYGDIELDREKNILTITQDEPQKYYYPNIKEVLGEEFPTIEPNSYYLLI